jgi:hypothetical protein
MRYRYNLQVAPPAPFIHVTVACPETGKQMSDLPAQIDTAADRTVLPGRCVDELGLLPLDELPIGGFGGQVLLLPSYRVQVSLRQLPALTIEAIAHPEEPFVLLGRDVLNQYRLLLDGPNLVLEIS